MRNLFAGLIGVSLLLAGCGGGGSTVAAGGGTGTQVTVPNVANDTQAAATSALTAAGLALGNVTSQQSTTVASGLVISESPAAGTSVAQGSMVNLVLSSGGIAVPNVVGDTQSAAQSAITGAGLTLGAVTSQASNTVASGNVISENPAAGTGVVTGTAVALVVSSGAGGGTTANNVVNAIVDQGPSALAMANEGAVNIMYVKVTVCAPGSTTTCQTIDHIQVDTGSQGLRIISSALNSTMLSALQPISVGSGALAECTLFVDGYSWGPIVRADLHVGGADSATSGEFAPNLPVQVIGTTTYPVPTDCATAGMNQAENTVVDFGANGIIGLGLFDQDCGPGCNMVAGIGNGNDYYTCSSSACSGTLVPVTSQMINPVFGLTANNGITDNTGVIIELPAVGPNGAANVTGTLVFGIQTQSNNALAGGVTVLTANSNTGLVVTNVTSLNQNDTNSYFDSGSNAIYFDDSNIPNCTASIAQGFFCPVSIQSLSANVTGTNSQVAALNFSIGPADTLFTANPSFTAYSNLGGSAGSAGSGTFAWGLPFYFGHNVYTAMENTSPGGTPGPYFAF